MKEKGGHFESGPKKETVKRFVDSVEALAAGDTGNEFTQQVKLPLGKDTVFVTLSRFQEDKTAGVSVHYGLDFTERVKVRQEAGKETEVIMECGKGTEDMTLEVSEEELQRKIKTLEKIETLQQIATVDDPENPKRQEHEERFAGYLQEEVVRVAAINAEAMPVEKQQQERRVQKRPTLYITPDKQYVAVSSWENDTVTFDIRKGTSIGRVASYTVAPGKQVTVLYINFAEDSVSTPRQLTGKEKVSFFHTIASLTPEQIRKPRSKGN